LNYITLYRLLLLERHLLHDQPVRPKP
jgi:hypothetical protein